MASAGEVGWFAEAPRGGYEQRYRLVRRLHQQQTGLQALEVVELESVGRALVLDGALQTSIGDEFTYHEPLAHVALCSHPDPRRVLIIGGGDGGTLRQVLLHPSVERVVEVEIDGAVVHASRQFLPEVSAGAYDDPRAVLHVGDGVRFVTETPERFDVILVDSTDPVGPAAALASDSFVQDARRLLGTDGLMAMQAGSPLLQPREWQLTVGAFRRSFPLSRPYLGFVPLYPGIVWSWVIGSNGLDPAAVPIERLAQRTNALTQAPRLYNPAWHLGSFALPTFLLRLLEHDDLATSATLRAAGHPLPGVVD